MDQAPSISGAASHTARPPVHFFFFLLGLLPGPRVNRQDKPDPVAWSMPDGFTLGAEPSKLDASLVGKHIYMRWKDYGWQLGKVYEQITSANPRLLKKYNYRVVWADTAKGPTSLRVENYAHGSDAALDSWVVLERKEGGAGGAE